MDDTQLMFARDIAIQPARAHVTRVMADGTAFVNGLNESEEVQCDVLNASALLPALQEGDRVFVWYSGSDEERGVILGRLGTAPRPVDASTPDTVVIEAKENLTLKCGEGSITIRADGKILIKGKDLVSHALRMNRIKGGAVSIN